MIFSLENNTYEIDNGYLFENVKRGHYYEATRQISNKLFHANMRLNSEFGKITFKLDLDSKHLESEVNHILDVIGTIGGSFELIHYILLTIYITLRKNLYFYTIIKSIRNFQNSQNVLEVKVYKGQSRISRVVEETKIPEKLEKTKILKKSDKNKKLDDSGHRTVQTVYNHKDTMGMYSIVRGYLDNMKQRSQRK